MSSHLNLLGKDYTGKVDYCSSSHIPVPQAEGKDDEVRKKLVKIFRNFEEFRAAEEQFFEIDRSQIKCFNRGMLKGLLVGCLGAFSRVLYLIWDIYQNEFPGLVRSPSSVTVCEKTSNFVDDYFWSKPFQTIYDDFFDVAHTSLSTLASWIDYPFNKLGYSIGPLGCNQEGLKSDCDFVRNTLESVEEKVFNYQTLAEKTDDFTSCYLLNKEEVKQVSRLRFFTAFLKEFKIADAAALGAITGIIGGLFFIAYYAYKYALPQKTKFQEVLEKKSEAFAEKIEKSYFQELKDVTGNKQDKDRAVNLLGLKLAAQSIVYKLYNPNQTEYFLYNLRTGDRELIYSDYMKLVDTFYDKTKNALKKTSEHFLSAFPESSDANSCQNLLRQLRS